jgi:hypothetical protein
MDQALNASTIVSRFGLATGRRRPTVQPRSCSPGRRLRPLRRAAGLELRRRASTRPVMYRHKQEPVAHGQDDSIIPVGEAREFIAAMRSISKSPSGSCGVATRPARFRLHGLGACTLRRRRGGSVSVLGIPDETVARRGSFAHRDVDGAHPTRKALQPNELYRTNGAPPRWPRAGRQTH